MEAQLRRREPVAETRAGTYGPPIVSTKGYEAAHPASVSDEPTGIPGKVELVDAYQEARGAALRELPWFEALTKYKESAATALLIKRGRKSGQWNDMHQRMLPALPLLLDEAMELLG
ncbi:hypothetical protein ACQP2U_28935 [Nocardia sp. CA-084685]|uniref:hypothetical protein n=1 Tax=Nocardia sp. CA-084685 TaxID=3239970 RepID=UPI003D964F77